MEFSSRDSFIKNQIEAELMARAAREQAQRDELRKEAQEKSRRDQEMLETQKREASRLAEEAALNAIGSNGFLIPDRVPSPLESLVELQSIPVAHTRQIISPKALKLKKIRKMRRTQTPPAPEIESLKISRAEYENSPIVLPILRRNVKIHLPPLQTYVPKHKHSYVRQPIDDHNEVAISKIHKIQPPKPKQIRELKTRQNHWVKTQMLEAYGQKYPVVLGIPEIHQRNYFRNFTGTVNVTMEEYKIANLLPYRFKKKVRIYGVSPMVLLAKPSTKLAPIKKPVFSDLTLMQPKRPKEALRPIRLAAPDVAPKAGLDDDHVELGMTLDEAEDPFIQPEEPVEEQEIPLELEEEPERVFIPLVDEKPKESTPKAFTPKTPKSKTPGSRKLTPVDFVKVASLSKLTSSKETLVSPIVKKPEKRRPSMKAKRLSKGTIELPPEPIEEPPKPKPEKRLHFKSDTKGSVAKSVAERRSSAIEQVPSKVIEMEAVASPAMSATSLASLPDLPAAIGKSKGPLVPIRKNRDSESQASLSSLGSKDGLADPNRPDLIKVKRRPTVPLVKETDGPAKTITEIFSTPAIPVKKGFLSNVIKHMNVVDAETKERLGGLSAPIFKKAPEINMVDMNSALKSMTTYRPISDNEIEFIKKVDQEEFLVIAALAEKMTLMDHHVRLSFYDTDFKKLESHIREYRSLFTVYGEDDGKMTHEDLNILLMSSGSSESQVAEVKNLLNLKDKSPNANVGFIDFLSYIPLFTQLHQHIVDNPFASKSDE